MPPPTASCSPSNARRSSIRGAYSSYPFSACLEAAQVVSILPGPYKLRGYKCQATAVATNKPPILPYRGVARTGVCFAMELTIDALARELGMTPKRSAPATWSAPTRCRSSTSPRNTSTAATTPRRCAAPWRRSTSRACDAGKREQSGRQRIGVGLSIFCEQGAHGTSVYSGWGIPMVPGFEQATARLTPDGGLELRVGAQSHGQSLETTLAQVAHEVLGIDPEKIKVVHGDTAYTPYSTGTWGSRCMVMAGGAVSAACEQLAGRLAKIAAHLIQSRPEDVILSDGCRPGRAAARSRSRRSPGCGTGRRNCCPMMSTRAGSRSRPATRL